MLNKSELNQIANDSDIKRMVLSIVRMVCAHAGVSAASDMVADAYSATWEKIVIKLQTSYDPMKGSVTGFLSCIAHNCATDALRALNYHDNRAHNEIEGCGAVKDEEHPFTTVAPSDFPSPEHMTINRDTLQHIADHIRNLSPRDQEVFHAFILVDGRSDCDEDDRSQVEHVCKKWDMTENAARILVCRIRKQIRQTFAE